MARLRDAQWRMREWQQYKDVDKAAVWAQMQHRAAVMADEPPLPGLENPDWVGEAGGSDAMAIKPYSSIKPSRSLRSFLVGLPILLCRLPVLKLAL